MSRAVLSLGSNLGDSAALLAAAVDTLGEEVERCSDLFATPPWGLRDQPDFFNVTAIVSSPGRSAAGWLARCRELETAAHRVRELRWGPRTLDADVITVDQLRSDDPELTLPHPRAHQRAFVLVPWLQIEQDAQLPGLGPVAELLAALEESERNDIIRVGPLGRR